MQLDFMCISYFFSIFLFFGHFSEDVGDVDEEVRQRAVEVDDLEELLRGSTADADSLGKAEKR